MRDKYIGYGGKIKEKVKCRNVARCEMWQGVYVREIKKKKKVIGILDNNI